MAALFQCPDCHAIHAEPVEARYVLAVRCEDCELDRELSDLTPMHTAAAGSTPLVAA